MSEPILDGFVKACRKAAANGLVRSSSGNLSLRLDRERMLLTGARTRLGELVPEQVAVCRIADGAVLNAVEPSAETGFHAGVLRERTDVDAVLHFQSPFATTLACCRLELENVNFFIIPEAPYYVGPVAAVDYFPPGSSGLAEAVTRAAAKHDVIILRNHGVVAVGRDLEELLQRAVFFELTCELLVRGGDAVRGLPPDGVDDMLRRRSLLKAKV